MCIIIFLFQFYLGILRCWEGYDFIILIFQEYWYNSGNLFQIHFARTSTCKNHALKKRKFSPYTGPCPEAIGAAWEDECTPDGHADNAAKMLYNPLNFEINSSRPEISLQNQPWSTWFPDSVGHRLWPLCHRPDLPTITCLKRHLKGSMSIGITAGQGCTLSCTFTTCLSSCSPSQAAEAPGIASNNGPIWSVVQMLSLAR